METRRNCGLTVIECGKLRVQEPGQFESNRYTNGSYTYDLEAELAAVIARALRKKEDIAQLFQVNRAFQNMYHLLLWTSISFKSEDYANQQE